MQPDDESLRLIQAHWHVEEVPHGLAERIIRHARSMPQHQPFTVRLLRATRHAFNEWNYALAYKGAALALVAVLGVFSGQLALNDDDGDPFTATSTSWTEEL